MTSNCTKCDQIIEVADISGRDENGESRTFTLNESIDELVKKHEKDMEKIHQAMSISLHKIREQIMIRISSVDTNQVDELNQLFDNILCKVCEICSRKYTELNNKYNEQIKEMISTHTLRYTF